MIWFRCLFWHDNYLENVLLVGSVVIHTYRLTCYIGIIPCIHVYIHAWLFISPCALYMLISYSYSCIPTYGSRIWTEFMTRVFCYVGILILLLIGHEVSSLRILWYCNCFGTRFLSCGYCDIPIDSECVLCGMMIVILLFLCQEVFVMLLWRVIIF